MRSPLERFITGENRTDFDEKKYNGGRIASKGAKKNKVKEN